MIYLDSCILIYAIESADEVGERARHLINDHEGEGMAITPLVEMECLVGPLKHGDIVTQRRYEHAFSGLIVLPMPTSVYRLAAQLTAQYGLRTADALHAAAALEGGCEELWTNDRRLSRAVGQLVRVVV